jgi:hypothetical protein
MAKRNSWEAAPTGDRRPTRASGQAKASAVDALGERRPINVSRSPPANRLSVALVWAGRPMHITRRTYLRRASALGDVHRGMKDPNTLGELRAVSHLQSRPILKSTRARISPLPHLRPEGRPAIS